MRKKEISRMVKGDSEMRAWIAAGWKALGVT